ncbi:MAG: hypothetical protein CVU97_06630 [Firmicutes bacterium HGW-Firmicutes-21]|nr:MAG: hypothetical protein CVU97_06630 [Firmicutes bacterium HGW-Firmicutes-21]
MEQCENNICDTNKKSSGLELTAAISAAAAAIAKCLSDNELSLLSAVFNELGDTLATILGLRQICASAADTDKKDKDDKKN